jgi:hypothetical protein
VTERAVGPGCDDMPPKIPGKIYRDVQVFGVVPIFAFVRQGFNRDAGIQFANAGTRDKFFIMIGQRLTPSTYWDQKTSDETDDEEQKF